MSEVVKLSEHQEIVRRRLTEKAPHEESGWPQDAMVTFALSDLESAVLRLEQYGRVLTPALARELRILEIAHGSLGELIADLAAYRSKMENL